MPDNLAKNTLIDKMNDSMLKELPEEELDKRIQRIKTEFGLLEQMQKLPGNPVLNKTITLRSIGRVLYGYKGESLTL